jgi:hypothetical protein
MADLPPALADRGGVRMLHIRTDRDANVALHQSLHAAVAALWSKS